MSLLSLTGMRAGLAGAALVAQLACAPGVLAQTDHVLPTVNRLRAAGGACAASGAPPLARHAALDQAAAGLAQGAGLEAAIKASGYRVTQAQVISVSGTGLRTRLEALLAERFCAQIGAAKLRDLGIHAQGSQIWIVLAAPFAPKVDMTHEQAAERMLALVNRARAAPRRCGSQDFDPAPALVWNDTLEQAAARHAADMAGNDYFSHTGRDGSSPAQRVKRAGYSYRMTGENIAAGQMSPDDAMAGWIKSPGHCANLMNARYTELGVAFTTNPNSRMGVYWVQLFGLPR